jgi:hypothetical protein
VATTSIAFAFRKLINVLISTVDRKQSSRVFVCGAERQYLFLLVFTKHLHTVL